MIDPAEALRTKWDHTPHTRDPWTAALVCRGHWVYFIYDARDDTLLYIGCTNNVRRRISEHHATSAYRREDVRYEIEGPYMSYRALRTEARYIAELRPPGNTRVT
jgi:hypothetical protein